LPLRLPGSTVIRSSNEDAMQKVYAAVLGTAKPGSSEGVSDA
jgi:hypothetical protein